MTYDTIKLQDALDTLDKIGSLDTPEDRKYAREMFLNIPSALPEHLTDEDLETIRIHLHAFMEGLCNQYRWKEAEEYERIIVRLKYLAMSQTGQWIFKDDTISRQAAIDVINHELRCGAVIDQCGLETAHDLIEELPSAQPEPKTARLERFRFTESHENGRTYTASCLSSWQCDNCKKVFNNGHSASRPDFDFCPKCGAKFEKTTGLATEGWRMVNEKG